MQFYQERQSISNCVKKLVSIVAITPLLYTGTPAVPAEIRSDALPVTAGVIHQPEQEVVLERSFKPLCGAYKIVKYIEVLADLYDQDPSLLVDLGNWESSLNPKAVNIHPNEHGTSTAGGVFMFTDPTWPICIERYGTGPSKFDAWDNVLCAVRMIDDDELWRWHIDRTICHALVEAGYLGGTEECKYYQLKAEENSVIKL